VKRWEALGASRLTARPRRRARGRTPGCGSRRSPAHPPLALGLLVVGLPIQSGRDRLPQ
jgi:hypothetical protein